MRALLLVLVMCASITICHASGSPSITARVSTAGGITTYSYDIRNDTAATINDFDLLMPQAGAQAVISFMCPGTALWNIHSFRGDDSAWGVEVDIAPGASKTAVLTTSASVPTSYTFEPARYGSNWFWNADVVANLGNSLLPVPVPEPSGLLALAGGIAGLGGFVRCGAKAKADTPRSRRRTNDPRVRLTSTSTT